MKNYFQILYQSLILIIKVYFFNRIRTNLLIRELNTHLQNFSLELSKIQAKRIHSYTIQSCLTNSWFSKLRGKRPNRFEIKNAVYLGAITPLLDDLVDAEKLESTEILNHINNFNESSAETLTLRYLYSTIIENCNKEFKQSFNQALISQDASLKQLQEAKLSDEELLEITKNKGASWTVLYRSILGNQITEDEKRAICTLGEILQLTNDAFDVYKDFKNGQQTLFTNVIDILPVYNYFFALTLQLIDQFKLSGYPRKNVEKATTQMMLIVARGFVCIEQLLECQKKTNNQFQIEKYSRDELVCDMEKLTNISKLIGFCNQFGL